MMVRRLVSLLMALGLAFVATAALAEDTVEAEPVVTVSGDGYSFSPDRPGFGYTTTVVPPWRFAFEAGTSLSSAADETRFAFPDLLVRMGMLSWLEVRARVPGASITHGQGQVTATDAGVGFKVAFAPFDSLGVSLVTMLGVPMTDEQSALRLTHALNLGFDLSDSVGVAVSGAVDITDQGWETSGAVGLVGKLGDASAYLQGAVVADESGGGAFQFGIGATRMITDSLQLDLSFDYALPESGNVVVIGSGLSFLL